VAPVGGWRRYWVVPVSGWHHQVLGEEVQVEKERKLTRREEIALKGMNT